MPTLKLAITSDLHLPITSLDQLRLLAQEIAATAPAALVVAGDIGESHVYVQRCLQLFREQLSCPIWVLAGNHDVWAYPPYDSKRLWQERLPAIVAESGCQWLEGASFSLGDIAVVGTIAWYDYTAADPTVKASALQFAQEKWNYNADALRIDWEWSDPELAEQVSIPFLATLERLQGDSGVRQIVVVTHVPLLEEQMSRDSGNPSWAFSNAYFGNLTLGKRVLEHSKVSHIISGHTHVGRQARVERPGAPAVEAHVLASQYEAPVWLGLSLPSTG